MDSKADAERMRIVGQHFISRCFVGHAPSRRFEAHGFFGRRGSTPAAEQSWESIQESRLRSLRTRSFVVKNSRMIQWLLRAGAVRILRVLRSYRPI